MREIYPFNKIKLKVDYFEIWRPICRSIWEFCDLFGRRHDY